jgi:hypothetical protein
MKIIFTLSTCSVIALAIWLCVDAIEQSRDISFPATLTSVKDLADH